MGNTSSSPTPTVTQGANTLTSPTEVTRHNSRSTRHLTTSSGLYTSIVPVYSTSTWVEESCRYGVGDFTSETCQTSTKSITLLLSFSTTVVQPTGSESSSDDSSTTSPPWWCPDYPDCTDVPSATTVWPLTTSTSTASWKWPASSGFPSSIRNATGTITGTSTLPTESCTELECVASSVEPTSISTTNSTRPTWTRSTRTLRHSYTNEISDILPTATSRSDQSWSRSGSTETSSTSIGVTTTDVDPWPTTPPSRNTSTSSIILPSATGSDDCDGIFPWWWCSVTSRSTSTGSDPTFTTLDSTTSSISFSTPPLLLSPSTYTSTHTYTSSCNMWDLDCVGSESPPFATEVPTATWSSCDELPTATDTAKLSSIGTNTTTSTLLTYTQTRTRSTWFTFTSTFSTITIGSSPISTSEPLVTTMATGFTSHSGDGSDEAPSS